MRRESEYYIVPSPDVECPCGCRIVTILASDGRFLDSSCLNPECTVDPPSIYLHKIDYKNTKALNPEIDPGAYDRLRELVGLDGMQRLRWPYPPPLAAGTSSLNE